MKKTFWAILLIYFIYVLLNSPTLLHPPVNAAEVDYLLFAQVQENIENYENSLTISNVKALPFNLLIEASKTAKDLGIDFEIQYIIFYCFQIFLGIMGIFLITSGLKRSPHEIILICVLFFWSYFTSFGRYLGGTGFNKVVVSGFGISIGYIAIGLFVRGKLFTSLLIASLLIYIHPTYALIFLTMFTTYMIYNSLASQTTEGLNKRKMIYTFLISGIIMTPFFISILRNHATILGTQIDSFWWTFLKARMSNPFPLQEGIIVVFHHILIFAIVFWLLGILNKYSSDTSFDRARWIIGSIFAAWIVQIVFTEVWPVSFIARLALTRLTPYAVLFMIVVYVSIIWVHRERDTAGIWFILLLLPILFKDKQLLPPLGIILVGSIFDKLGLTGELIYPESLFLFIGLIIYTNQVKLITFSLNTQKFFSFIKKLAIPIVISFALLFVAILIYIIGVKGISEIYFFIKKFKLSHFADSRHRILILMLIFLWIGWMKKVSWINLINRKLSLLVFVITVSALILPFKNMVSEIKTNQKNSEIQKMLQFIDTNTDKSAMILVIPIDDTRYISVMPLRSNFLDWYETSLVLYNPTIIKDVAERLKLIGMEMDKSISADNCSGLKQYLQSMCRRKIFAKYSEIYNDDWRENLEEMRKIAPNLYYILMKKQYMCSEDKPTFISGDLVLLSIEDVYKGKNCNRESKAGI